MDSDFPAVSNPRELLDAFVLFTRASQSLEGVHSQLLRQIEHLTNELEATNSRLRDSLSETEAMRNELLGIIECQPNGVLVLEPLGRILYCNRQVYELLGLDPDPRLISVNDLTSKN